MLRRGFRATAQLRARPLPRFISTSAIPKAGSKKDVAKEQNKNAQETPKSRTTEEHRQSPSETSSPVDSSEVARDARKKMAKQIRAVDEWPNTAEDGSDSAQPLVSPTAEDLLKQRFLHAQKRTPGSSLMLGGSGTLKDMPSFFRDQNGAVRPEDTSLMGSPSTSSSAATTTAPGASAEQDAESLEHEPDSDNSDKEPDSSRSAADSSKPLEPTGFESSDLPIPPREPSYFEFEQPFNTHNFVRRLEDGGWIDRSSNSALSPGERTTVSSEISRRHDPAEAVMDLTRKMLQERGEQLVLQHIDRSYLDNRLYLFSSALSELRTEVRVRARNDAAALRSLTSLLQREVDGLSQKMQAEVERLKHDIQVDMNQRKHEVKEENNSLELDIQDLNNRFTIFLSDLKTEIEQSIKWDATRRALALVFGIVAILVSTLALADYFSRPEVMETARKIKERKAAVSDAPRVPRHGKAQEDSAVNGMESSMPKSAEEWGLVPRYDSEGEVRYV
ncbi:heme o synthase [Malassezia yamatoensis]|uniref:Heme o synthase n=1 Tax=Malassezia yamatoensis TaxID=253288 RepID=A0AAJ5YP32_9BASI|nr:heme o synthase [Malassezia yamatoensis]